MRATRPVPCSLIVLLLACFVLPAVSAPGGPPPEGARLATPVLGGGPVRHGAIDDEPARRKAALIDAATIHFRNGLEMRPAPGVAPELGRTPHGTLLLQFPGPASPEDWEALADAGITVHGHVQWYAVVATVPAPSAAALVRLVDEGVLRYAGPYPATAKIARGLEAPDRGEIPVRVHLLPESAGDRPAIRALLRGATETGGAVPAVAGRATPDALGALAARSSVLWIDRHPEARGHNLEVSMSGAADAVAGVGQFDGTGIRVAINDTGIARTGTLGDCGGASATYHPDLPAARILDQWDFFNNDANACDDGGHGTHVAGTIGGLGLLDGGFAGIAPGASLLIYKDANAQGSGHANLGSVLARAASHDANVVSNPWGRGNGVYDLEAYNADSAVLGTYQGSLGQPQEMIVVASGGNDAGRVTSPGTGKNVITVGAMKDGNWPAASACFPTNTCSGGCDCDPLPECGDSFGPSSERICFSNFGLLDTDNDGASRIKPDLVAPGTRILSTEATYLGKPFYDYRDGTSSAQAAVAGTTALMLEAYPVLRDWPQLIKARLLATTVPLGDVTQYGHGMLDSFHAIYDSPNVDTVLWAGEFFSFTGQFQEYSFAVPPGYREVRVYLVFSDKPSLTTEAVHDLDLRVYDATNFPVGLSTLIDDNVEFVHSISGAPGLWRANVYGFHVDNNVGFGIIALVIMDPAAPALSASATPACVPPGAAVQVISTYSNPGDVLAASQIVLDLPDDPSLVSLSQATLWTNDAFRTHTYPEPELYRDPLANSYRASVGLVGPTFPRTVTWDLAVGGATPDGIYDLPVTASSFGGAGDGATASVQVEQAPGEVQNLQLAPDGNDVLFSWDGEAGSDLYHLEAATSPTFGTPIPITSTASTSYTRTGGMLDTTPIIYFRVTGENGCGVLGP